MTSWDTSFLLCSLISSHVLCEPEQFSGFPRKWKWNKVLVAQSYPTLCNPMDCSPPGSSVYAIFQARIQEWAAIPFSRGSFWPRDWTWVSCIAGEFFTILFSILWDLCSGHCPLLGMLSLPHFYLVVNYFLCLISFNNLGIWWRKNPSQFQGKILVNFIFLYILKAPSTSPGS